MWIGRKVKSRSKGSLSVFASSTLNSGAPTIPVPPSLARETLRHYYHFHHPQYQVMQLWANLNSLLYLFILIVVSRYEGLNLGIFL